jgi:large subunit ribosomal protein L24
VTVEHANMIKKHTRPNPSKNIKGGILEKEGPLHVSNVLLVCPGCGKHTRAGHTTLPDGTKVRSAGVATRLLRTRDFCEVRARNDYAFA